MLDLLGAIHRSASPVPKGAEMPFPEHWKEYGTGPASYASKDWRHVDFVGLALTDLSGVLQLTGQSFS
jgi:hypothetical protein